MGFLSDAIRAAMKAGDGAKYSGFSVDMLGTGGMSKAGMPVSDETAASISAVYRCVDFISNAIMQLPVSVLKRRPDGSGKDPQRNHALWNVLASRPNTYQNSCEFRKLMQGWLSFRGNAYAWIEYDSAGGVTALWPIHPDFIRPRWTSPAAESRPWAREIAWDYFVDGQKKHTFLQGELLHLKGFTSDGLVGLSVISTAKETLGLALAAEDHGSKLFGQGAMPSGIVTPNVALNETSYNRAKEEIIDKWSGRKQAGKLLLLNAPFTFSPATMTNEDAQFLQTRKFEVIEICRWFGVPPHLVYELDKATFSNIEHQSIEVVVHTVMPWIRIWEQGMENILLAPEDRKDHEIRFNVNGLLRGDFKTRMEGYRIGREIGLYSANDILRLENENGYDGGDTHMVPSNMQIIDTNGNIIPAPNTGRKNGDEER